VNSISKTHHIVCVEQGWSYCGIGSEISARISESMNFSFFFLSFILLSDGFTFNFSGNAFFLLDAPVMRVTGADIPMPYCRSLETACIPQPQDIVRTVKSMLNIK